MFLCSQTNFWRWDGVHDDVPRDRVRSRSFRDRGDAHDDVPHDRARSRSFQDGDRGGAHADVPHDRARSCSFRVWEPQRYVWKFCVSVL